MRDSTVHNFHQNNGGAKQEGAPSADIDFSSSIKTAAEEVPPSSFEFHVWSDDGIDLHVDLNSPPSDWTNRFKNEVQMNENVRGNKSSLRQDLGFLGESSTQGKCSFLWNANSVRIDVHSGQAKSSSSLKLTKDSVAELDRHNKGDNPLISGSLTPCSMNVEVIDGLKEVNQSFFSADPTVNVVDNLKQERSPVSAEVSYDVTNNFVSGAESWAKVASKAIFDSDATNTQFIKSFCDSLGNSLSDPCTLERQSSKHDNEFSEDCDMLNGSCLLNPGLVCPGASLSSSMELQLSEVASCQKHASISFCGNDGSLDLSDPKNTSDTEQCGPVNSSEINLDTNGNNLASLTEEWEQEVGKIVDGRESSECSQFNDRVKKSGLDYDDHDSKMALCRKRKNRDSEIQGSSGTPVARILRSMKNTVARILPRRSMRRISK